MAYSGLFGQRPKFEIPDEINQAAAMPAKKGGFFSQGGFGRYLAGGIADGIAAASGMQPGFANSIEQKRIADMYKQRQADEMAQYERRQQIEAQYDKPAQPHYWESNDGSLMSIGPDGQPVQVYQDKTPKPYMVTNADGTITPYIYNSETSQFQRVGVGGPTGSAGGMPPVKGKLKPYGGGTGSGSGNFPR